MAEAERPMYKRALEDAAVMMCENSYEASIILDEEVQYFNNVATWAQAFANKYHKHKDEILAGASPGEVKSVMDRALPAVKRLKWPVASYPLDGEKREGRKIKIPVIPAILFGVYDLESGKLPDRLVVRNPEKPYTWVVPDTELIEEGITVQLPEESIATLYGYEEEKGKKSRRIEFLRESDFGIAAAEEPRKEANITDAQEIPALKALEPETKTGN